MSNSLNRIVKINNQDVNYKREGDFLTREIALFEKAVDRAFLIARMSANILNNARVAKSDVEFLFGDSSYKTMSSLKESFKNVQETFFTNFTLSRKKEYSQTNSDVLASTNPEANRITLYDAFFEYSSDVKILGAVLLHEFLHLAGLASEDANMNLESAKAVEFLSELLCKIKSREAVQNEIEKLKSSEGESDDSQEELYDPNPNRHPKGQSNGGQFAPKNNKKGDEASEDFRPFESGENSEWQKIDAIAKNPDADIIKGIYEDNTLKEKFENFLKSGGLEMIKGFPDGNINFDFLQKVPKTLDESFVKNNPDNFDKGIVKEMPENYDSGFIQDGSEDKYSFPTGRIFEVIKDIPYEKARDILGLFDSIVQKAPNDKIDNFSPNQTSTGSEKINLSAKSDEDILKGKNDLTKEIPDKYYLDIIKKVDEEKTDKPVGFIGDIDSEGKSINNFESRKLEDGSDFVLGKDPEVVDKNSAPDMLYCAKDLAIGNLEPNKEYSTLEVLTFETFDGDNNMTTEHYYYELKGKSDANGVLVFKRVGIANSQANELEDSGIGVEFYPIKEGLPGGFTNDKDYSFTERYSDNAKESYAHAHATKFFEGGMVVRKSKDSATGKKEIDPKEKKEKILEELGIKDEPAYKSFGIYHKTGTRREGVFDD